MVNWVDVSSTTTLIPAEKLVVVVYCIFVLWVIFFFVYFLCLAEQDVLRKGLESEWKKFYRQGCGGWLTPHCSFPASIEPMLVPNNFPVIVFFYFCCCCLSLPSWGNPLVHNAELGLAVQSPSSWCRWISVMTPVSFVIFPGVPPAAETNGDQWMEMC